MPWGNHFVNILEQTTNPSKSRMFRVGFPYKLVSTRRRECVSTGNRSCFCFLTHTMQRFRNWQPGNQWRRENIYFRYRGQWDGYVFSKPVTGFVFFSPMVATKRCSQVCGYKGFFFSCLQGFTEQFRPKSPNSSDGIIKLLKNSLEYRLFCPLLAVY